MGGGASKESPKVAPNDPVEYKVEETPVISMKDPEPDPPKPDPPKPDPPKPDPPKLEVQESKRGLSGLRARCPPSR